MPLQIPAAVEPRPDTRPLGLMLLDRVLARHGQPDIIQAIDQAMLPERLDLERRQLFPVRRPDDLVGQIDFDLAAGRRLGRDGGQCGPVGDAQRQHAVLERVVEEDVAEAGRDDALDAEIEQRPGSVLAAGAAAEVGTRADEDLGVAVGGLVEDEGGVFLVGAGFVAPRVEECGAQAGALDGFEELLGDDGVGVDVGDVHGGGEAAQGLEFGHACAGALCGGGGGVGLLVLLGEVHELLEVLIAGGVVDVGDFDFGGGFGGGGSRGGEFAHVGEVAYDGGGGGHDGRHQVGAAAGALAAFEVAVRGGCAALARCEDVWVHAQAHGAAGLTPVEAGFDEDLVETLLLGALLDKARAGDDHGVLDVGGNLLALDDAGGSPQVLNTCVCARSDEDLVDGDLLHGGASGETHVLEGTLACLLLDIVVEIVGSRNDASDGDDILGRCSPRDGGRDVLGVDVELVVELGVLVRLQAQPVVASLLPLGAVDLGGQWATLQIVDCDLIGSDHSRPGSTLDGHVADRHAGFHAKAADGRAAELNDSTGSSSCSDNADDVQDDVLAADAGGQLSVDLNLHVLTPLCNQGLRSKDVLDLAGTDTEGKSAECAVCGGVAVTADHCGAGEGEALLGSDDVDDTLPLIVHAEVCEIEGLDIVLQGHDLCPRVGLFDELLGRCEVFPRSCGDVLKTVSLGQWYTRGSLITYVIDCGQGAVWSPYFTAGIAKALEGLLHALLAIMLHSARSDGSLTGDVTS